jgi:ribosomal protein S18 acetylase RimI-like enzyme
MTAIKIDLKDVAFRPLDISYIPALLEIQEETFLYAAGQKDFLRRNTEETFAVCFPAPSLVLGAYLGGEMIAFGILHAAGETKENLAHDIEDVADIRENANVKLTIVRPGYRGNGLQAALITKMEEHARREGFRYLSSTVSPTNPWSSANLEKCGFRPYKTLKKYGGMERILYFKEL